MLLSIFQVLARPHLPPKIGSPTGGHLSPDLAPNLRQRESVAFANGRGRFGSLVAIHDDQDFVVADRGVAAEGAIGDDEAERAVTDAAAEQFGDVNRSSLHTVVSADNADARVVIAVPVTMAGGAIAPILAIAPHRERGHFDDAALPIIDFGLLVSPLSDPHAQRVVDAGGTIAPHGLIPHRQPDDDTDMANDLVGRGGDIIVL